MVIRRALRGLFHMLLTLYMGTLVWVFWQSWTVDCIKQLNVWLVVYCLNESLHTLTRVVAMCIWGCANDPELAETRLTIFFKIWVYVFEAIWVIYGSTFIYSDEVSTCDDTTRQALEDDEDI